MAILTTAIQGIRYPDHNEYLNTAWSAMRNMAQDIEVKLVMVFASQADLTSKIATPTEGMMAWLQDGNTLQIFDGSAWQRLAVGGAAIYSGTGAPASSLGAPGDVYIQQ